LDKNREEKKEGYYENTCYYVFSVASVSGSVRRFRGLVPSVLQSVDLKQKSFHLLAILLIVNSVASASLSVPPELSLERYGQVNLG